MKPGSSSPARTPTSTAMFWPIGPVSIRRPNGVGFTGAAPGLREDADFDRVYLAVGTLDPGRGDVVAGLDIGNALLDQGDDGNIGGELDRQRLAVPRFDHQILAVEFIDRAADAGRRAGGRGLGESGPNHQGNEGSNCD